MTGRGSCVPLDRLTALALSAHAVRELSTTAPETAHDRQLLSHVADCHTCAATLAELTADLGVLRAEAWRDADAAFDESALETQRLKILDRLAHLGQVARVLRFPGRVREASMPGSPVSRRWISVAAAAGLIIGLVAGQMIHLVPWDARFHRTPGAPAQSIAPRGTGAVLVQASSTIATTIDDDELMDEIDEAMQLRRAATLRALDAFTPRVGELTEIR